MEVNLGSTFGQRWVNPRSTLGQPSVSSLAISGRFSLILPDCSIMTDNTRKCISEMVDFPIRKQDFRVRGWSGAFWEPQERKKEKTKCSYKNIIPLHRSKFNILANFHRKVLAIFKISSKILLFFTIFIGFCTDLDENFSEFRQIP